MHGPIVNCLGVLVGRISHGASCAGILQTHVVDSLVMASNWGILNVASIQCSICVLYR